MMVTEKKKRHLMWSNEQETQLSLEKTVTVELEVTCWISVPHVGHSPEQRRTQPCDRWR